ncbi:MAG: hypothetical protein KL787_04905 [Taibaiella sp.]|nr:hypothetical protein [Taibaiella sp.]
MKDIPVRIYNDVDVCWWIENRNADLYAMNAVDQSAMINLLRMNGNTRAEFINAYQKGYRLEGMRHPHSWSIVDPEDCIDWISSIIKGIVPCFQREARCIKSRVYKVWL